MNEASPSTGETYMVLVSSLHVLLTIGVQVSSESHFTDGMPKAPSDGQLAKTAWLEWDRAL